MINIRHQPDILFIEWSEFADIYPIFESAEYEGALWHKEDMINQKFIFLFYKEFPIATEIYYDEIWFKAKAEDEESKENALNEFRQTYLLHSRPFLKYGGL